MNVKQINLFTIEGYQVDIKHPKSDDIFGILCDNRNISTDKSHPFFQNSLDELYDPFLFEGMENAVKRIFQAIENNERIVVFGDYDVDGVSSTAVVVKFLHEEFGAKISYRLPHRAHDGYGLKNYFFDELSEKNVKLVITVDCGTRDIEPIAHAKKLGIDVIVTDHHAVPEIIPTEVIAVINPKRKDITPYPFAHLAGAGVALKLIHALLIYQQKIQNTPKEYIANTLIKYIDLASLGTVADCMPLVDENRIITTLGLKQMKNSHSAGLKKFVENTENLEGNASVIGFQIGPRINAAGRMDSPIIALQWLLASKKTENNFFEQLENLNAERKHSVEDFLKNAISAIQKEKPILFFYDENLEHGLIGLVAGKLTEQFNRVSVVLCPHQEKDGSTTYVASCRAPEWADLMPILDASKSLLLRYGGHKQAAGFSISPENYKKLQEEMEAHFYAIFGKNIPAKTISVEAEINLKNINIETLEIMEPFKPFGIGNPEPIWLLKNLTILSSQNIGKEKNHKKITFKENPEITFLFWNSQKYDKLLIAGNVISIIANFEKNIWNENIRVQGFIKYIVEEK